MHVAYVLLPAAAAPVAGAIAAVHSELWPGQAPFTGEPMDDAGAGGPGAGLTSTDGIAHVVLAPTPVAGSDVQHGAAHSLASLGSDPAPTAHAAHLVVTWFPADDLTLLEGFVAQSRLLAAILVQTGATAVHLPAAAVTHPAEYYTQVTRAVEAPIMLWTGLSNVFTEDRRHEFLSFGMHQFGLPDLLLTARAEDGSDALELFYALLERGATSGHQLREGEVVATGTGDDAAVRYELSPVDPGLTIARLDL